MRVLVLLFGTFVGLPGSNVALCQERPWRSLPLIKDGKVDPNWAQIGYGSFGVEDGALRSDCDEKGLGLLLYKKEKFGDCQIRVVYKCKDARSNSGVFIRIGDGIERWLDKKPAPINRTADGQLSAEELKKMQASAAADEGPWYAVNHGYEVQICETGDEWHRTGSIYSLAKATAASKKKPSEWKTMVITLEGEKVLVDVDGTRVTTFQADSKELPARKQWYEPRREPKRPTVGYFGLQTHDPGDVVYFKEISVR